MSTEVNILPLTHEEHTTIANHVSLPKGLSARLRFAVHTQIGVEVRLSDAELDTLTRAMLELLSETEDLLLADILTGVLSRMHPGTDEDIPEEFDRSIFPEEIPDEICQEIHTLLREGKFDTIDEAYAAVHSLLEEHNDEPLDALLGLTPAQGYRLLSSGWNEPGSAIQVRSDLTAEDLAGTWWYSHALIMLGLISEAGGAQLTQTKNLNRKWVQRLIWALAAAENAEMPDENDFANITEQRCPPVHYLRILLEMGGMVRVHKGKLVVTKLGKRCLDPAHAGELQAGMFLAMVRKFNLAYYDGAPEYEGVQGTYAYILYALGEVAREPVKDQVVSSAVYLPDVAEEFAVFEHFSHAHLVLFTRVLRPLRDFGMVSLTPVDKDDEDSSSIRQEYLVQTTPLFYRMIHFDL